MIPHPDRPTAPWPEIDGVPADARIDILPPAGWYASVRSATDFALACLLLVFALPLILICWSLVRMTSRGPGFYSQVRSGLNGEPYRIVKLRTMEHNVEARSGIRWAHKGDCRVTRLGRFLRATHLDELPQLFNVLRGEMSLVGPRPERPEVIVGKGLGDFVPGYKLRLAVKPGVTGLAQLQLPADIDIRGVRHKVAYDLHYIANRTLWLDLRLILATALKSVGFGPGFLRWLFRLPRREDVAVGFRALLAAPAAEAVPDGSAQFQTV